jgi:hypothetical protein
MAPDLWLEKAEGLTNQDVMIIHFAEFYEKGVDLYANQAAS